MSIDYRGQRSTGLLSKVTNTVNGEKYNISTVRIAGTGEWETSVFKQTLLGAFRPLICMSAQDERQARRTHDRVENIAERSDPAKWKDAEFEVARISAEAESNAKDSGTGADDAVACFNRGAAPRSPTKLITPQDEQDYGLELIDLAKRAAKEVMDPELDALRQATATEIESNAMTGGKVARDADSQHPDISA